MKKYIILSILFCAALEAKRAYGLITIGTGWTNFYQTNISDWVVRNYADFLVQTKGPYVSARQTVIDGNTYNFYHIPIGILQSSDIKVYVAPGTLLDLDLLIQELQGLERLGIDTKKRIRISATAQILMPYEKLIGQYSREQNMSRPLFDVRTGVGIAGADKCMGVAFRLADLMSPEYKKLLKTAVDRANNIITKLYIKKPIEFAPLLKKCEEYRTFLKPYVRDGIELKLNQMLSHGKVGIFDSPYGTYLDNTHGTALSGSGVNALASSICSSAGIGIKRIKSVLGIVDVFSIYPGKEQVITVIKDPVIQKNIERVYGKKYRKDFQYGWLDLVLIRQAVMINGIDCVALNGLHLLDDFDEICLCIDYDLDGRHLDYPSPVHGDHKRIIPHYITLPGWKKSTKKIRTFNDLPQEARILIKQIELLINAPVALASVGFEPHEMIVIQEYFFPK